MQGLLAQMAMAQTFKLDNAQCQLFGDGLHAWRFTAYELGENQAFAGGFNNPQAGGVVKVFTAAEHALGAVETRFLAADKSNLANRFFYQLNRLARAGVKKLVVAYVVDE
ncbi:hypothetical protein D3C77_425110 [compost metagenome]